MTETPTPPTLASRIKERLTNKRLYVLLAIAVVVGLGGGRLGRKILLAPKIKALELQNATLTDLTELYRLQKAHFAARGTYANDLDSLLAIAPTGAQLRERMSRHMDMNTVTVVGDEKRFKLEANVLDKERTLIKLKGPFVPRARAAAPTGPLPLPSDLP